MQIICELPGLQASGTTSEFLGKEVQETWKFNFSTPLCLLMMTHHFSPCVYNKCYRPLCAFFLLYFNIDRISMMALNLFMHQEQLYKFGTVVQRVPFFLLSQLTNRFFYTYPDFGFY
jgi:hypothetical protein